MRPHPRIRKTIKWGGLVLTVVLVAVWVGSMFRTFGWTGERLLIGIRAGCVDVARMSGRTPAPGWYMIPHRGSKIVWWYWFDETKAWGIWRAMYPLWWAILGVSAATASAWVLDRLSLRAGLRRCNRCGYDRSGLASSAECPECGAAAPPAHP